MIGPQVQGLNISKQFLYLPLDYFLNQISVRIMVK